MAEKNTMGSLVVDGFKCKPQMLDENKPIMFAAIQIFLCEGERCKDSASHNLADKLRELIKELGFNRGKKRVKITRTFCNGACRYSQFAYTYKNAKAPGFTRRNSFTAWKKVHEWTDSQWKELIISLVEDKDTPTIHHYRVEQQTY